MANDQNWNRQDTMNEPQRSGQKNEGSFSKEDPERAKREGRKGGQASRSRRS